jgi:hypothetical protein
MMVMIIIIIILIISRTTALLWRGSLRAAMTWRAMLAGAYAPGSATQHGQVKEQGPEVVPGPPGWGLGHAANDPTPEKYTVTKPWRRPRPTQG